MQQGNTRILALGPAAWIYILLVATVASKYALWDPMKRTHSAGTSCGANNQIQAYCVPLQHCDRLIWWCQMLILDYLFAQPKDCISNIFFRRYTYRRRFRSSCVCNQGPDTFKNNLVLKQRNAVLRAHARTRPVVLRKKRVENVAKTRIV
jgi:hypothetical protein